MTIRDACARHLLQLGMFRLSIGSIALTALLASCTSSSALPARETSKATSSAAVQGLPIIDMHLHVRRADYVGPNPPPMCAPFTRMPYWDPSRPIEEGLDFGDEPPC